MNIKRNLFTIGISIIIMLLLMLWIYDFQMSLMNVSNIFFVMGTTFFFPGLIVATGATELFDSCGYLTRKVFFKNGGNNFKTLNDYKEYKNIKNAQYNFKGKGMNILVIGSVYIVISLAIGMVS